jgi:Fe-S-cluster containining protein
LTPATLAAAVARGDCPFLVSQLCGVHTLKPAACRIYFCDQSATHWQNELAERVHAQIRALHDLHAIPYRYGEWRELLALFLDPA